MSDTNKNSNSKLQTKKKFLFSKKHQNDTNTENNLDASKSVSEECIANREQTTTSQQYVRSSLSDTAISISISSPLANVKQRNYNSTADRESNKSVVPSFILHRPPPCITPDNTLDAQQPNTNWKHLWLTFYALFYIGYLFVGCIGFRSLEIPIELKKRTEIRERVDSFLIKYPQIKDADLEDFLQAVITANDRGISPLRNASNEMNWSFGQALFFSSTVLTTIGYGHVTPLSQTGKIFCMIYATVGIPLTLVLITAVVERLLIPANWFLGVLNSKFGHLYQPFNIRLLHLSIIFILVLIIFFAIPTTVFASLEPSWGALDAFYYCFISLTTIGLGDYIPGQGVSAENHSFYKICITCYLIFGLIAMMLVLTIFYDIPQLNLGQLFTESVNGETEKLRLSANSATCYSGTSGLYLPQTDDDNRRAIVRIRPHGTDSPSPEETPTATSRDRRIP